MKNCGHYKDYIEYMPSSNITKIDSKNRKIDFESFDASTKSYLKKSLVFDDANIIPTNRASKLIKDSGLAANAEGWARAKSPGFESLNDEYIYIVGDLLGEYPYPKSAQMATSCGAILGEQIAKRLKGEDPKVGSIMPSNVCYSMVSDKEAIAVNHYATYSPTDGVKVKTELYENRDKTMGDATKAWYTGITGNIFE